jgi:acyl transferase domain-containing protein
MLAADGRCKTLDASADGYVRGEGCEVLLLSRERGGSAGVCAAVLLGSAVNQDGRSSSLTAPHGPSQQAVVLAALRAGGICASSVGSLQLHGTGTALGDPIEVGAASSAVLGDDGGGVPLVLSAVKSALGHGECVAGLTGVCAGLRGSEMSVTAPVLHLRSMNTHVCAALASAARSVAVARGTQGQPRVQASGACGVSSFAFQGTNAHALVQSGGDVRVSFAVGSDVRAMQRQRHWVHVAPLRLGVYSNSFISSS